MLIRILMLFFSLAISPVYAQEPMNLGLLREQLIKYHDTGEYEHDLQQAVIPAKQYLLQQVALNQQQPKKLAIVFDIDETVLSNYKFINDMRFGGTIEMFDKAALKAEATTIEPVLELYRQAIKNNVAVFFISGRKEYERQATVKNLQQAGYSSWEKLYLKPAAYKTTTAEAFKTPLRKKIMQQGYAIILNVGDQQSDLIGGYGDKGIKLPNPFYYIP